LAEVILLQLAQPHRDAPSHACCACTAGQRIGRWKAVIGHKLKALTFENQKTEAKISVRILNRMTELGRPKFERNA
jgi:hypothetical protein